MKPAPFGNRKTQMVKLDSSQSFSLPVSAAVNFIRILIDLCLKLYFLPLYYWLFWGVTPTDLRLIN